MKVELTAELKTMKEEFDFLYKKIGELQWERAIIYLGKKAIYGSELDKIEEQIGHYTANMRILIENIQDEVVRANQLQK